MVLHFHDLFLSKSHKLIATLCQKLRTVAYNTILVSVDRCLVSITMMPVDYSCPIQTTPFVSGWKETSVEYNIQLAQMQVHTVIGTAVFTKPILTFARIRRLDLKVRRVL